jgi:hypothetical protein
MAGEGTQAMIPLLVASLLKRPPMWGENIAKWLSRMRTMYSGHQEFLVLKGLILCMFPPQIPFLESHSINHQ